MSSSPAPATGSRKNETFALVTWIVYLIVVHVRVAVVEKAWWTAALSVVGFGVMLFNWIGVNFFLVGLHSYA
jgi:ABC-type transport system involved in cytochrome c biogenesis permease subunit